MKKDFPYKEGDTVLLYLDYQNERGLIGAAELVKFHRFGRSFILVETMPESEQEVYNYQEWITTHSDKPYKIRFLECIGLTNSSDDDEYFTEEEECKIIDSFIEVNGIQCF